jgi:hypothetical protein
MPLLRALVLLSIAILSTWAFAADDRASFPSLPFVADSPPSLLVKPQAQQPWFSGMRGGNLNLRFAPGNYWFRILSGPVISVTPGVLSERICLTMRSYKVKRTERLSDDESLLRGYSTCEMASNYQVRTTVGRQVMHVPQQ